MAWIILFFAGLFEIAWAVGLKLSGGFTRVWPSAATLTAMLISFFLLSKAVKTIELGTAYAVWTGIGAAGTAICGMAYFGESRDFWRLSCIVFIIAGVIGLRLSSR